MLAAVAAAACAMALGASAGEQRRASALVGAQVVDRDGARLGRIVDVASCGPQERQYAVLSLEPELGLGDKLYTYPLELVLAGHGELMIDIERKRDQLVPLSLRQYDANAFIPEPRCTRSGAAVGKGRSE